MPQIETTRERSKQRARLDVRSPAFLDGGRIPTKHTADGADVSPPLEWSDPPAGTQSFAILCEDPDAPSGTFVHWIAWNIRADQRELPEGLSPVADASDVHHGRNHFGRTGYGGPSPPRGKPHRYVFRAYALDARPTLPRGATRADFERAIHGHVLAEGSVIGLYGR